MSHAEINKASWPLFGKKRGGVWFCNKYTTSPYIYLHIAGQMEDRNAITQRLFSIDPFHGKQSVPTLCKMYEDHINK